MFKAALNRNPFRRAGIALGILLAFCLSSGRAREARAQSVTPSSQQARVILAVITSAACGPSTLGGSRELDNGIGYLDLETRSGEALVSETHLIANPALCQEVAAKVGSISMGSMPLPVSLSMNSSLADRIPVEVTVSDKGIVSIREAESKGKRDLSKPQVPGRKVSYLQAERQAGLSREALEQMNPCGHGSAKAEDQTEPGKLALSYIRPVMTAVKNLKVHSTDEKKRTEVLQAFSSVRDLVARGYFSDSLYTREQHEKLMKVILNPGLQIHVVERLPSVKVPNARQNGAGLSGWMKSRSGDLIPVIFLQRDRLPDSPEPLKLEGMLHHELCVIAGCEETGKYELTDRFKKEKMAGIYANSLNPLVCTLFLFDQKKDGKGFAIAGTPRGASAIASKFFGYGGRVTTLETENPGRVLRVPYVIGNDGFLKIRVYESDPIPPQDEAFQIQKNGRLIVAQEIVFNPYTQPEDAVQGIKDVNIEDRYILRSACTHQSASAF